MVHVEHVTFICTSSFDRASHACVARMAESTRDAGASLPCAAEESLKKMDKTPAKSENLEDLLLAYWANVQERVKSRSDDDLLGPEKDDVYVCALGSTTVSYDHVVRVRSTGQIHIQYIEADQARHAPKLFKLLYPDGDASKAIELYDEMTQVHTRAQEILK